jgi:Kdo2-lipid IVA lauroyltransferase/acyltransferase
MSYVFWFLTRLSHRAQRRLGAALGWFVFAVLRIRRGVVDAQLRAAFPTMSRNERRRVALGAYRNMMTTVTEGGLMARLAAEGPRSSLPEWFTHEGFEHVKEAEARGQGTIIVTGHLGNFDLFGVLYAVLGVKLNIVARDIKNKKMNALWVKLRESSGLKQISAHRRQGSLKKILQALQKNETLAVVLDQNMSADKGVFVEFFGRPACTLDLAAVLAKRTGAAVIPAFMMRKEGGKHHARFFPPLQWIESDNEIVANTQLYTQIIEDMVRAYPEQWLWLHRRWKTQPTTNQEAAK